MRAAYNKTTPTNFFAESHRKGPAVSEKQLRKVPYRFAMMEPSVALENVAIGEEPSPESLSASVDASTSPSTDSGYTEANSSADSSTQTQASDGESNPSGDATVVIKEEYV